MTMGKHVLSATVLAFLVGCGGRPGVPDAGDPRAVIEKAIQAQGGEDKLSQFKAGRWTGRGTLTLRGQTLPLTLETVYQLPDKYKTVMRFEAQGTTVVATQAMEGGKGWMAAQGKTLELDGKLLQAFQEEFYSTNVELLVPLLREGGYTLAPLKEATVAGKPAVGVRVSAAGHKDIELYFDRDSYLPVKTVRPTIDVETMKDATAEVLYGDVKEYDGVKWPGRMVVNQDGKKLMEVVVTEFRRLDTIDPGEFARPR
jgi:hypothetical protein